MKLAFVVIPLLFAIGCSSSTSIVRNDPTDLGFHRTKVSHVGPDGNTNSTHIVFYSTDFFTDMSFLAVAQDTATPESISIMIAAKDSASIGRISIFDSLGNEINFSKAVTDRFQNLEWKHPTIASADLGWDKFGELCRRDSILLTTEHLRLYLGKSIMRDLNILLDYLQERDPNEPPADNPSDDVVEPSVVKKVDPDYPQMALKAGWEGDVQVKAWVDRKGKVRKVVLMKSNAEIFEAPALDAAQKWEFTPAKILGKTVSVWVSIPFRFRILKKD